MRDYGKVYGTFWSSPTTASMSDDAKLLALYLMTCQHNTIAGAFRLPDGYVAEDLSWTAARVAQGFAELFAKGFATRCEGTKWVWIVKHLCWNKPENPNQVKSAAKVAQSIPDECGWKPEFMRVCGVSLGISEAPKPKPLKKGSRTVAKPETETETETGEKKASPSAPSGHVVTLDAGTGRWTVPDSLRERWRIAYPAVSVEGELAKASAWLTANPKNRKSNNARFLNSWLSRAQDKAPTVRDSRQSHGDVFAGAV